MGNLKKNLSYQTAYQILSTILPLITAPYLARVLGAARLGVFSYTNSVVSYFVLFSMLGFAGHGARSIAAAGKDKTARSKVFFSIFSMQALTTTVSLAVYLLYLLFWCKENRLIAVIQTMQVLSCFFDINWLFTGMENFRVTVTRSFVVRVLTVAAIFLFVRSKNDLWIYVLLMSMGTLLGSVALWFQLPKLVSRVRVTLPEMRSHIRPSLMLFVPLAAMTIYHVMDKTMLGILSSFEQSGYYYNADKAINIPAGIIGGFSTVFMPRAAKLASGAEVSASDAFFNRSMKGTVYIASAMAFGIAAVAEHFVPFFFGQGYDSCVLLIVMMSPILIIKAFSFSARYQFIIPRKLDAIYIKSVICGAVVNLISNVLLIPRYGALGAVIGTILAELTACLIQYVLIRRQIDFRKSVLQCGQYLLCGLLMLLTVRAVALRLSGGWLSLVLEIAVGVASFLLFSYFIVQIWKDKDLQSILKTITDLAGSVGGRKATKK